MSASIRSQATVLDSVGTTSHVCNVPAGVVNGDVLIFFGVFPANPTCPNVTLPVGWTQLWQSSVNAAGGNSYGDFQTVCAYRIASSEPANYTFGTSLSDRCAGVMVAVQGAVGIDTSNNNTSTTGSTTFTTPSISPSSGGDLILALMGSFASGASSSLNWTPDAAFTEYSDNENTNNHSAVEVEYKLQNAAAAISATATSSLTVNSSAGIVAITSATAALSDSDTGSVSSTESVTSSAINVSDSDAFTFTEGAASLSASCSDSDSATVTDVGGVGSGGVGSAIRGVSIAFTNLWGDTAPNWVRLDDPNGTR